LTTPSSTALRPRPPPGMRQRNRKMGFQASTLGLGD
jgi:hypothetical protein